MNSSGGCRGESVPSSWSFSWQAAVRAHILPPASMTCCNSSRGTDVHQAVRWGQLAASVALGVLVAIVISSSTGRSTFSSSAMDRTSLRTTVAAEESSASSTMQSCEPSHFILRVMTNNATYSIGDTVQITMSIRNKGQSCLGIVESGPCVDGATVSNSSGQIVWVSNFGPYSCPASEPEIVPHGWNDSDSVSWLQKECPALGSQCTNTQVSPGRYSVVGKWGVSEPAVQSRLVKITINGLP